MRSLVTYFTLVFVAIPGTMAVAADSGDERPLVESLIDAWNKREHALRSCEVRWKSVQFMSEEYFRILEQGMPGVEQPHEGKSYTQQYGLSFDGPKLRFEIAKLAWSAKQQRFLETPYLSVFDGQIGKSLWGEQENVPYPSGTINADKAHPDISTVALAPVMLSCRPFGYGNSGFAFPPDHIRKNSQIETIRGRRTVKLRQQSGERLLEVWVDSTADFRVSRFVTSWAGRIDWQCRMEYASVEDSVIPASWQLERFSNRGTLLESNSAEVSKVDINPRIPAERFTIEYPVGSAVFDARLKKRFIIQAPGNQREVLRSEIRFSHDALMKSSTGRATEGEGHFSLVIYAVGFLVLIAGVALSVWRWRRLATV